MVGNTKTHLYGRFMVKYVNTERCYQNKLLFNGKGYTNFNENVRTKPWPMHTNVFVVLGDTWWLNLATDSARYWGRCKAV